MNDKSIFEKEEPLPITGGDLSLAKFFTSFKRGANENRLINTQLQLGGYNHAMFAMHAKIHTLRAWRALREEFNFLIAAL